MLFSKSFSGIQRVFRERYEISTSIRHGGERGRQREHGLTTFLRETLPEAYGVATGEIIPYRGEQPSPQCDVIVYDMTGCSFRFSEGKMQCSRFLLRQFMRLSSANPPLTARASETPPILFSRIGQFGRVDQRGNSCCILLHPAG